MAVSVVEQAPPRVWPRYGRARQALVRAAIDLSARVGFHGIKVAELSASAGVGPRTFYNHFADLSDLLFEACWQMYEDLRQVVQAAYDGADTDRAYACVEAVVTFIQADPAGAQVLLVQSYAGGPAVAELRAETFDWLIGLAAGGRGDRSAGGASRADRHHEGNHHHGVDRSDRRQEPFTGRSERQRMLQAEMAVGGINEVLRSRVVAGQLGGLTDLVPQLAARLKPT